MKTLNRKFYQREPAEVAKDLLGKYLVRTIGNETLIGKIVETEAYLAENDLAAHSARGKTKANASLFLDGGYSYVHRIHAYYCLDAVCQTENVGGSVLIRAIEPIEGVLLMKNFRAKTNLFELANGPGKLSIALNIDKGLDGIDLTLESSPLKICSSDSSDTVQVLTSKRIGISKSKDAELRFYIKDSKFTSR